MSGRLGHPARAALVFATIAIAAVFSGDGNAAPGREGRSREGRSITPIAAAASTAAEPAGPLGVVPIPPPPSVRPTSTSLALAALDRRIADLDAEEESSKRELSE